MSKKMKLVIFSLLALLQLAVPGYMIIQHEDVFKSGTLYKFETAPVDPCDPFRGRYVSLSIKAAQADFPGADKFSPGDSVYVVLKVNAQGFAEIDRIQKQLPENGDYFVGRILYGNRFSIPFDKYYMEEGKAPEAERAYWMANSRTKPKSCWVAVKIKNGKTSIVDLYIDGMPIKDYLKTRGGQKK